MNFRTELHIAPSHRKLTVTANVATVGSCFSDVIGQQLEKYKINTLTNPFGTIFNPLSACKLLQACCGIDVELSNAFVKRDGRWYSYDFHSTFSAETEEALYELLDEVVVKTRKFLKTADLLILTLGTANVFRLNITGETVANCHKMPASNFEKETLNPEEIIAAVAETQSMLRELNPDLRIVLSVSPVRHMKDTLELNSVSKSVLRLATHYITQQLPEIYYFPAYELLLDDLRDYRFYKADLLHPSDMAENYIWQKFNQVYFDEAFREFTAEWDKVLRAMEHKPFQLATEAHQNFVQSMLQKLDTLKASVNTDSEIAYFQTQVVELPIPVVATVDDDEETLDAEAEENRLSEVKADNEIEEIPEIDDEIIESKYPARKIKKAAKKGKRDLFLPETGTPLPAPILPAETNLAAASGTSDEPLFNETPEERKRRKKKERRKKKKQPSPSGNVTSQEIPTATSKVITLPVTESNADVFPGTPEMPEPPVVAVRERGKKIPKKGKVKNAIQNPEISEPQELSIEKPAVKQAEASSESTPDQISRPIVFSKYYLERLQQEKEEKTAAGSELNESGTAAINFPADAEVPALLPAETNLPVAALGSAIPASVSEAPVQLKKRGGKTKKQAPSENAVDKPVSDLDPLHTEIPAENQVTENLFKPQAFPISEAQAESDEQKNQKGKNRKQRGKKQAENPAFQADVPAIPESKPSNLESPVSQERTARPFKAAKSKALKTPDSVKQVTPEVISPEPVAATPATIAPEPEKPKAGSKKTEKPKLTAKKAKAAKSKAVDLPLFPEPVITPTIPSETASISSNSKEKKEKPAGKNLKTGSGLKEINTSKDSAVPENKTESKAVAKKPGQAETPIAVKPKAPKKTAKEKTEPLEKPKASKKATSPIVTKPTPAKKPVAKKKGKQPEGTA